jgi:hypothetical protein
VLAINYIPEEVQGKKKCLLGYAKQKNGRDSPPSSFRVEKTALV